MSNTPARRGGIPPFAVLYCDSRWGDANQLVIGYPDEVRVRIHDLITHTVGYIVADVKGVQREIGTAFFINIPTIKVPGMTIAYLVVAKHVVFDDDDQPIPRLSLRVNMHGGMKRDLPLRGKWYCSENEDADVAIMGFGGVQPELVDVLFLPYRPEGDTLPYNFNTFADVRTIQELNIGLGDEVRVVGLYTSQSGHRRIEPIVRAGILSAMPSEPVTVRKDGKDHTFNAHLIEVRSLGGLSGAPVFVLVEANRIKSPAGIPRVVADNGYRLFLLGMVRGRHRYKTSSIQSVIQADRQEFSDGLAYVTPIQDVVDVLYSDLMQKERDNIEKEILERHDAESTFKEDSAYSPLTRNDFEDVLRQASRKVSQPEKEKKETSE